jgi:RND superfamily putative drug exporter
MSTNSISNRGGGLVARAVHRAAGASSRRPRLTILLWLVLVGGCVFAGATTGTKTLTDSQAGVGESARADARLAQAGLRQPATESILVRAPDPGTARNAADALSGRLGRLRVVGSVEGPRDTPALSTNGGRTVLVRVVLRGDPDHAVDHVAPVQAAVAAVSHAYPRATVHETGRATVQKALDAMIAEDLGKANLISLPVTLVILFLAFGALVAASVPLLLGVTSVAAGLGLFGVISQFAPDGGPGGSMVALIGLAVGVDYSLFYVRREREERRAGKGPRAALDATAATVGRAIVVSGVTVMVALAGLLFTGLAIFTSMALATIAVVAIAMIGSVTVLPAALSLLGDRVDKGRIPFLRRDRRERAGTGAWARIAGAVTRHPAAALVTAVCVLGALAVPTLDLKTANSGISAFPAGHPARVAQRSIERAFPGAPSDAQLVVTGRGLDGAAARQGLRGLGDRARRVTHGRGAVTVDISRNGRTAVVSVPMPDRGVNAGEATVKALRDRVAPTAARVAPGAEMLVTGAEAQNADFTNRLSTATPIVIAAVLGLAFLLLLAAFGSARLAAAVVGLNLLSVGASYGVLVAIFQHTWAESLLNFTSTGTVSSWLPLFAFVILFGLSMDYTIIVLERIREARRAGLSPREAAAEGVSATAGTVTSAAVVMVTVFAAFASTRFLDTKQLGVGLSVAILIDATIVRAIALPAAVALIGPRDRRVRQRGWDDGSTAPVASVADAR